MTRENPTPEPAGKVVRRQALKLGVLASLFSLVGRAQARAADTLTIEPDGTTIDGRLKIEGKNSLEFGAGVAGKEVRAGEIGYQIVSDALDIVGAGTTNTNRKIKLWAEGGVTINGTLTLSDKFVGKGDTNLERGLTVTGDAALQKSLQVAGPVQIDKNNTLEFGAGVAGKEASAGKIGYQVWSDGLDIVGAGTRNTNRKIKFFAEAGATLDGPLTVSGSLTAAGNPVAAGVESLSILRGIINPNGTKAAGSGFTQHRRDTGLYDIIFDLHFSSVPGASATQLFKKDGNPLNGAAGSSGDTRDNAVIVHLDAIMMRVATGDSGGGRSDRHFSFIVIGPR